jgi:hypothetical protein
MSFAALSLDSFITNGVIDTSVLEDSVPQNLVNAIVKTMGIYTMHRPSMGASSLGSSGTLSGHLDVYIEGTLVKFSPIIIDALKSTEVGANGIGDTSNIPALPIAKLHIDGAINEKMAFGISGIYYPGNYIVGGHIQRVLWQPEEGLYLTGRLAGTYASIPVAYTTLSTWSPQIVVGKAMSFADPYIGISYTLIAGTFDITLDNPPFPITRVKARGGGSTASSFMGVIFRLPLFRLGLEGSYNLDGFHTVGSTIGMSF